MNQPTKLVLINSGTFGRAVVDLTRVSHFVAKNNLGKTSLLTTLQFLYVSNHQKHQFPTSLKESRKHYFRTEQSYIIFECRTSGGIKTVLFRGKGELEGYDYERKLYTGPYKEQFFFDTKDTIEIREPDETDQLIAGEGLEYHDLEPRKHRGALRGTSDDQTLNLGLVPTTNQSDYDQFCELFVSLLQLNDLRQDRIENLFISVYERDLSTKTVSLYDYAEDWESILEKQQDLETFQAQKYTIDRLLSRWEKFRQTLNETNELGPELHGAYELKLNELDDDKKDVNAKKNDLEHTLDQVKEKRTRLRDKLEDLLEKKNRNEEQLDRINKELDRFSDYEPELSRQQIDNLKRSIQKLQSELDRSLEKTLDEYEREIAELKERLNKAKSKFKNSSKSLFNILKDDFETADLNGLFSVLNPDLLSVSTEEQDAHLDDPGSLKHTLETILEKYQAPKWQFEFGDFSLESAVISSPDLDELSDSSVLNTKIERLEKKISTLEDRRDRLEREEQIKDKIREKKEILESKQKKLHAYEEFRTNNPGETRNNLQDEISNLENDIEDIRETISENDQEIEFLIGKLEKLNQDVDSIEQKRSTAKETFDECKELLEELTQETKRGIDFDTERRTDATFENLVNKWHSNISDLQKYEETIDDSLSTLQENLTDYRVKGLKRRETIEEIEERKEAFEDRKRNLEREWQDALTSLASASENLLESLNVLDKKVNRLNGRINQQQVSNLEYVKLNLDRRTDDLDTLKRTIRSGQTKQELFDNDEKARETSKQLQQLARAKEELKIKDMFGLSFEIKKTDGKRNEYTDLSKIQSRGTTITIKILFSLILLNGLLKSHATQLRIPYLIDEVLQLDRENIDSIRQLSERLNFVPFFNGTTEIDGADVIYQMKEHVDGKVYLDKSHRIELTENDSAPDNSFHE